MSGISAHAIVIQTDPPALGGVDRGVVSVMLFKAYPNKS